MPGFIDITDRKRLNSLLDALQPGTPALWGRMNAQNMIEHLVEAVEYTNGKKVADLKVSIDKAKEQRENLVLSDFVIPNSATGYLPDATKAKRFKDLKTSILELNKELDAFEYFFKSEGITAIHFEFGPMNYAEWVTWHGKHFTHHFKQFGLLNQ
jgi:oxepin-CoA hydrolase/3-oxo-5,6-dehydrosuberyl-CoA semialdehyde dehydrogenase